MHPFDANREMLDTGKRGLVGVLAGGVWISWAVVVARPVGLPVLVVVIAAGSVLFVCCAYCVLTGRRSLPEQSRLPRRRLNWGFLKVSMLEGIGVGVAVVAAQKMGRLDLLPDWLGLVIGLHFFLLARVFREPVYNLTAAAITTWCLLSLVLFHGSSLTVAVGLGIGAMLWATAGFRLFRVLIHRMEG